MIEYVHLIIIILCLGIISIALFVPILLGLCYLFLGISKVCVYISRKIYHFLNKILVDLHIKM